MNLLRGRLARGTAGMATLALGLVAGTGTPVAVASSASPVHVVAARAPFATNQSDNWSGYNIGADYPGVATGTPFTSITGEWVVPKATQHQAGQAEDSATWIGIGGGCVEDSCTVTDNTLIQAGTEQDVSAKGKASYDAWWEIVPEPETETTLPVHPGNKIRVAISQTVPGVWSIKIKNLTTGKSFTTTTPYSSSMDTAEWIEETPLEIGTSGTGLAAMPNLGVVKIAHATLNGANPKFQAVDEMQLSDNGTILATPSAPNHALNGFNDCTFASTCAAP